MSNIAALTFFLNFHINSATKQVRHGVRVLQIRRTIPDHARQNFQRAASIANLRGPVEELLWFSNSCVLHHLKRVVMLPFIPVLISKKPIFVLHMLIFQTLNISWRLLYTISEAGLLSGPKLHWSWLL